MYIHFHITNSHRPIHSHTCSAIDEALDKIPKTSANAYVIRKIRPLLPSYGGDYTVSVPFTRIRDIAHRSDIPKHLKDDIKHNLQNKLHRCAGPEDLVTAERIWVCSCLPVGVLVCTRS